MTDRPTVRAILSGMALTGRTDVRCAQCAAHLEGARVAVVARNIDAAGWRVVTVSDVECGPETVPETPLGESALATARLGVLADVTTQSHTPALLDVEIVDAALDDDTEELAGMPDDPGLPTEVQAWWDDV